jgi:DNA polymerase III subunit beta
MKFTIQRKHIRAMLHLSAKKDIRYYLQGLHIVRDNRGTYIEATDGHILGRLLIDDIRSDTRSSVILPSETLLKLKGTKKQGDEWLHFSVDGLAVECISGESTLRFQALDNRFPDADRVIPLKFDPENNKPSTFNPDLLVRFVDASEDLYGKRVVPCVLQQGTMCSIISFPLDDAFVGVMMPYRETTPGKVPEWCYKPSQAPEMASQPA